MELRGEKVTISHNKSNLSKYSQDYDPELGETRGLSDDEILPRMGDQSLAALDERMN